MGELTAIEGVLLRPLREIQTDGGPVLHMLRADAPWFGGFGEVYFSLTEPGCAKAWKRHTKQTQNFAVPSGLLEVVIYDAREGSRTQGKVGTWLLGRPGHYGLLTIPPGLWYGFACRSSTTAVLANCADIPHEPEESERLPLHTAAIPYHFGIPGTLPESPCGA